MIDLRSFRTRMMLAFAIAIALHEVLLALLHPPARPNDREDQARTTRIAMETMRPTPRPTPRPTAPPTPRPTPPPTPPPHVTVPPRVTPAPVPQIAGRAKGHPAKHRGGGAHRAIAKAATGHYANPKAAGSGTGTSVGHGSGNTPGTGGGLGGNGTGNAGNGNGGVNADTPCGVVEFVPFAPPEYHSGTAYEPIKARVTFADGHKEDERFPYKWVYPNGEQNDPWSNTNLAKGDFPIVVQTPPPGTDPASLPPLIQYILQHSRSDGTTQLIDCPKGQG